jgi:hypothetical protein
VPFVVTGISQDGNTIALEQALKDAGLSLEALDVITPEEADQPITGGIAGSGIITGGGLETGTGVPGLTGAGIPGITSAPSLIAADEAQLIGDSLWDRLADLAIPDDEVENYAEALEDGRSIVAYHGDSKNVANVEGLFATAGLTKVKTF